MITWRIALLSAFVPLTFGASAVLTACNDDVDTPPWLRNYVDSGYGGASGKGGSGGTTSSTAGAGGVSAASSSADGEAGSASSGAAGAAP